jgi:hypothetical protein
MARKLKTFLKKHGEGPNKKYSIACFSWASVAPHHGDGAASRALSITTTLHSHSSAAAENVYAITSCALLLEKDLA